MFLVVISILLGYQSALCHAGVATVRPATAAAAENTNMKSINMLKQHLRRNNDDYKASSDPKPNNKTRLDTVPEEIDLTVGVEPQNRRGLDIGTGGITNDVFNSTPTVTKTNKFVKVTQKVDLRPTKLKSESSRYPKYVNKEKGNKPSKSRGKHSDPRKQLFPSASMSRPEAAPSSREGPAPTGEGKAEHVLLRADLTRDLPSSDELARVPSPYELDMAPAVGGLVHDLRSKNRLCSRHVMIPEGPKYDSKGGVYLRAHQPGRGRDYSATRAPRLLLPRCCNCCRKSVLGCQ